MLEIHSSSKGIDWLLMDLIWSRDGTKADMKVDPRVEEFFNQFTAGQTTTLNQYGGREWGSLSETPLSSYLVSDDAFLGANHFFLGCPGYGLTADRYPGKVNLSFLHLVGASKGDGLRFTIKTPVSGMAKLDLRMRIERGVGEFVRQYLTFGKISFRVSSYEV